MADLLVDFSTYFQGQGITSPTYFYDSMLDTPDSAVAIMEYQGHSPMPQIYGESRAIQIVSRARMPEDAKATALALYAALSSDDGIIVLTASRTIMIGLQQSPFKIKVDEKARVWYGFNAVVTTNADS